MGTLLYGAHCFLQAITAPIRALRSFTHRPDTY